MHFAQVHTDHIFSRGLQEATTLLKGRPKHELEHTDLLTLTSYTTFSLCSRDYGTFLYLPTHLHIVWLQGKVDVTIPSLQRRKRTQRQQLECDKSGLEPTQSGSKG